MVSYKERFSQEKINEIIEAFKVERNVTRVAKAYELAPTTLSKLLDDNGIERTHKAYPSKLKICSACGKKAVNSKANFCCYCGADLRTEKELEVIAFEQELRTIVMHHTPPKDADSLIEKWAKIKTYIDVD